MAAGGRNLNAKKEHIWAYPQIAPSAIIPLDASPYKQYLEELAPWVLLSLAAPPWAPAWQSASSELMLTTPGAAQNK
eukprot:1161368-Pelagomonas_calceolata.AAC.3